MMSPYVSPERFISGKRIPEGGRLIWLNRGEARLQTFVAWGCSGRADGVQLAGGVEAMIAYTSARRLRRPAPGGWSSVIERMTLVPRG
jgi:hypothetical protein